MLSSDENKKGRAIKISVVHDHLGWMGGGERTALVMAINLEADFITAYASPDTYSAYQEKLGDKLRILSNKVIYKEVIRFFWLRWLYWHNRKLFKDYDILIASGQTATEVVANYAGRKTIKILYNHTPPRRIYDLFKESRKNYKLILQPLFSVFAVFWRFLYMRALKKIDIHIANSGYIRNRIKKYTHCDVNYIVRPPIAVDKFKWLGQKDYFLSWGRLDENKRVDLIVEAFVQMPEEHLIVASGGMLLDKIREIAKGHANITVLGWVSDEKLSRLAGECRAAIYIPHNEDAGMTHLEANAAGKPALIAREGGVIESSIENETCRVVKKNPEVNDIVKAVRAMSPEWCLGLKEKCINHAQQFSTQKFNDKIKDIISICSRQMK